MPLERDEHGERLARIEQMLEDLRVEFARIRDSQLAGIAKARLTRERSAEVHTVSRKLRTSTRRSQR